MNDDVVMIMHASDQADPPAQVNPFALMSPVSPHIAAKRQKIAIDIDTITECAAALARGRELLLIEGAGGWHAPISESATMANIARALRAPVLLVVGLKLGCLNHARLTLESIRRSGLGLAGWIGSELDANMAEKDENRLYLEAMFGESALSWLPFDPDSGGDGRRLASALPRLLQVRASS
jgi:dethiobiotin synthetase